MVGIVEPDEALQETPEESDTAPAEAGAVAETMTVALALTERPLSTTPSSTNSIAVSALDNVTELLWMWCLWMWWHSWENSIQSRLATSEVAERAFGSAIRQLRRRRISISSRHWEHLYENSTQRRRTLVGRIQVPQVTNSLTESAFGSATEQLRRRHINTSRAGSNNGNNVF